MRFAFILQHFEPKRWLLWVVEIFLKVVAFQVVNAGFEANGALFKDAELLVAHGHVVEC